MVGHATAALNAAPARPSAAMWRNVRIAILLLVLGIAAYSNWYDRLSTTDWDETLWIGVFPIDDGRRPGHHELPRRLSAGPTWRTSNNS